MRVFLQSIFGQIILSAYIFWRGRQALPQKKSWQMPFMLVFVLELAVFFIGYLFHDHLPDGIFVPLMFVCNTWYIASLYVTIFMLVFEGLYLLNKRWAWYPMFVNLYWDKVKILLAVFVTCAIVGLMRYGYGAVRNPIVQHVYITVPKKVEGRDSLKIVMTSDWHIGEMVRKKHVKKAVDLCNAQNPDIIFVVGDIIDYESRFAEHERIEEELRQLKAPLGVYGVLGNHEYRANRHAKMKWLAKTGMTMLVDSVAMPDTTLYVIGRDDYINRKSRAPLNSLIERVDLRKPVIVLDHTPKNLTESVMNHADLVLSGHTHNGQLWPNSLLIHFLYECPYGYYRKGDTQFFVSSGVGCAGPPYRIGTHSEIVVLHVRFRPSSFLPSP